MNIFKPRNRKMQNAEYKIVKFDVFENVKFQRFQHVFYAFKL